MKTKILFIAVMFLAVNLMAQKANVTKDVKDAFVKLYPKAENVKYEKEGKNEFEIGFKNEGLEMSVVMDSKGNLIETETEIKNSDLPKGVEEFVKKNHPDYKITELAKISNSKGNTTFEVALSKGKMMKDLIFDKDGKFIPNKK